MSSRPGGTLGTGGLAVLPARIVSLSLSIFLLSAAVWADEVDPPTGVPADYTVLLASPSVGERLRASRGTLVSSKRSLQARAAAGTDLFRSAVARDQEPVVDAIEGLDAEVLRVVRNVLNAVFVRATPEQADAIRALEGVAGVVPGRRYQPMLKTVSEIVGVSAARVRPQGSELLGDGIKIGIVDSGLDFDHEAFSDPSLPALEGYPRGEYRHMVPANPKVIAVRSYVGLLNSRVPATSTPDDTSPWDLSGHGTAVAMVAAGRSVETPLGPVSGVAPNARIGVYKVFGSPGLNYYTADHAVIAALDDAVEDGMDIVNLSLGNPMYYPWDAAGQTCGRRSPGDSCNPLAVAAQSLVEDHGLVVVAAAGNNAAYGVLGTPAKSTIIVPGNAPGVITVGATGNSVDLTESVRIGGHTFDARTGSGPGADGPVTAPAVLASAYTDPLGCEPYPEGVLQGTIAVIDRGECFFLDKVEHADAAGAAAALVINHEGDDLVSMALLGDTDIPAFFIGQTDGERVREAIRDPANLLTLDPTPVASEQSWEFVGPQSSRGPNLALLPKPDLVAPGLRIYTAAPRFNNQGNLHDPSGFRTNSGTSIAAPVVTGAAALVWQAYPALSGRQVASAVINSAARSVLEDREEARLVSAGAGVLDIAAALRPSATAVPPTIGFGSVRGVRFPVRRQLVISNKSARPQSFLMTVEARDADSRARVTIDGRSAASFTLGPSQSREFPIRLQGIQPVPGSYEGRLRLTSGNGSGTVTIPYLYVVGDNEPHDALRFQGRFETGIEGETETKTLVARVLDRFGAPVAGQPVQFTTDQSTVSIGRASSTRTSATGLIVARVTYAPDPEDRIVTATVGQVEIPFFYSGTGTEPEILSIANSADATQNRGVAPGSIVTIEGSGFARHASGLASEPRAARLPLSRKGVSVSFDATTTGVSEAGRIHSVDEDSLTVQVPWELFGAGHAFVKVRGGNSTEPFRVPVVDAAPGIFSYSSEGRSFATGPSPRWSGCPARESGPFGRGGDDHDDGKRPRRGPDRDRRSESDADRDGPLAAGRDRRRSCRRHVFRA